ncbi:hypothetical protein H0H81_007809 [Sphagnurus paluster]|uniref:Uncharacterized protein n=1 Tax=Sphagnurus paluster TaxID=117069 RepID=A0A9P7FSZ7_9AGAR|nr:hypothetical protein H0H81_007809 [Sphagnurus paluster]
MACRTPADSTSDICDPSAHRRFTEKVNSLAHRFSSITTDTNNMPGGPLVQLEINVEQSVEYVADADTEDPQPAFHLHV